MEILMATRALDGHGGSESYLETVVDQLRQLGHDVTVYTPNSGRVADRLRSTGVHVVGSLDDVGQADVAHVQHAPTAFLVRARFPRLPVVYVCHSSVLDIEDPPALAGPQSIVALSDLVARRAAANAAADSAPVVRLRQPVAVKFREEMMVPIADVARRAVFAGRRTPAFEVFVGNVCAELGIEVEWTGGLTDSVEDLTPAFMRADIVFAVGRTLLEAMALGRAGFVLDERGSGGFVTTESYPRVEAGAFAAFDATPMTETSLSAQLRAYDASIGRAGYELVRKYHSVRSHARDLVLAYAAAIDADPPPEADPARLFEALADCSEQRFQLDFVARGSAWSIAAVERRLADAERRAAWAEEQLRALQATKTMRWLRPLHRIRARLPSHG